MAEKIELMDPDTFESKMSLFERIRAATIILRSPYIERVDVFWKRPDGNRSSRIWVGIK